MAVSTLISVNGIIPPRPPEALVPIQRVARGDEQSAGAQVRRNTVRDLSAGLGDRERQRIHILENAERLRELAKDAEVDRQLTTKINALDNLGSALTRVAEAAAEALATPVSENDETTPASDGANGLEQLARDLARTIGASPEVGNSDGGPEVVTLDNFGFQPGTLGTIEAVRGAADDETSLEELRIRAEDAAARVEETQERLTQERTEALERSGTPNVQVDSNRFEARYGILTSEQARDVVSEIDALNRVSNGAPLIEHLTTLVPDNVLSVVP